MDPETIKTVGEYIVIPICITVATLYFLYFLWKS